MGAVADYLHESYLYEQIELLDESISTWLKTIRPQNIIDSINKAIKNKDAAKVESILRVLPKSDFKTLYTISSKINDKFASAFNEIRKEAGKKFSNLKGTKLDLFSLIFATTVVSKPNIKKASKEIVFDIDSKLKKAGVKNFGAEGMAGISMLLMSGIFASVAFATLSLTPMLIAIGAVGLAVMTFMK